MALQAFTLENPPHAELWRGEEEPSTRVVNAFSPSLAWFRMVRAWLSISVKS